MSKKYIKERVVQQCMKEVVEKMSSLGVEVDENGMHTNDLRQPAPIINEKAEEDRKPAAAIDRSKREKKYNRARYFRQNKETMKPKRQTLSSRIVRAKKNLKAREPGPVPATMSGVASSTGSMNAAKPAAIMKKKVDEDGKPAVIGNSKHKKDYDREYHLKKKHEAKEAAIQKAEKQMARKQYFMGHKRAQRNKMKAARAPASPQAVVKQELDDADGKPAAIAAAPSIAGGENAVGLLREFEDIAHQVRTTPGLDGLLFSRRNEWLTGDVTGLGDDDADELQRAFQDIAHRVRTTPGLDGFLFSRRNEWLTGDVTGLGPSVTGPNEE